MSGAYHFDSRSSTHLQSPRNNASQPTQSKPYQRKATAPGATPVRNRQAPTPMHWTTHCLTLEDVWAISRSQGTSHGQHCYTLVAFKNMIRKVRQHVCVSGFGVDQSASSFVCRSFVVCDSVREWRVLGSILAGAGKLSLLCTGLPYFSIIIIMIIIIIIVITMIMKAASAQHLRKAPSSFSNFPLKQAIPNNLFLLAYFPSSLRRAICGYKEKPRIEKG